MSSSRSNHSLKRYSLHEQAKDSSAYLHRNGRAFATVKRARKACTYCADMKSRCDSEDPCHRCAGRGKKCVRSALSKRQSRIARTDPVTEEASKYDNNAVRSCVSDDVSISHALNISGDWHFMDRDELSSHLQQRTPELLYSANTSGLVYQIGRGSNDWITPNISQGISQATLTSIDHSGSVSGKNFNGYYTSWSPVAGEAYTNSWSQIWQQVPSPSRSAILPQADMSCSISPFGGSDLGMMDQHSEPLVSSDIMAEGGHAPSFLESTGSYHVNTWESEPAFSSTWIGQPSGAHALVDDTMAEAVPLNIWSDFVVNDSSGWQSSV